MAHPIHMPPEDNEDDYTVAQLTEWDDAPIRNEHKAQFGYCEDAPCCGCCGPGSDDPAYDSYEPLDYESDYDNGY